MSFNYTFQSQQVSQQSNELPLNAARHCVTAFCRLTDSLSRTWHTIEIAAAATAVLTAVPGTMLLSDVLTSTASRKRFPTGSTFWEDSCGSRTVDLLAGPAEDQLAVQQWQQRREAVYHETFVERRVYGFEDFTVWLPFGFTLVALAPFVVFRGQKKAERVDLCLVGLDTVFFTVHVEIYNIFIYVFTFIQISKKKKV